jgi:hypothetical protein
MTAGCRLMAASGDGVTSCGNFKARFAPAEHRLSESFAGRTIRDYHDCFTIKQVAIRKDNHK